MNLTDDERDAAAVQIMQTYFPDVDFIILLALPIEVEGSIGRALSNLVEPEKVAFILKAFASVDMGSVSHFPYPKGN